MPGKHALSFSRVAVFSEGATLRPISANILVAVEFWLHTSGEEVERQVARNGCYRSSRFGTLRSNEGKRRGAASMTKAPGRKETNGKEALVQQMESDPVHVQDRPTRPCM